MAHGAEQWQKARALFIAGKSIKEIEETTGIPKSSLQKKCAREKWNDKRKQNGNKTATMIEQKISEQAAQNVVDVLAPLREVSTELVQKVLEIVPQIERANDVRALAGAIKDMSQVIRDLNGILTHKEELQLQQEKESDTEIRFIIETESDNGDN